MIKALLSDPRKYVSEAMGADIMAGITVAVMLIPQGMAYALLAGLPPIYGLYAALVPMLVYPFFGSSDHLSVGPVALVSIIVLTGLSEMAEPMSAEFIQLAFLTALVAGVIQVLLSLLRMGFLVNFLSHPVITGFTSAAALIIAVSQLKYLFGLEIPTTTNFMETVAGIIFGLDSLNVKSFSLGLGGLVLILLLKQWNRKIPGALVAVVVAVLFVWMSGWGDEGLQIVGEVPSGLPAFMVPEISWALIQQVLPLALVICLISFIESLAIAKTLASKHDRFDIDANKELLGLGLAKILGSFFQAFPNTGSFTRSAINEQAGSRTGMSSIFGALVIGITLIFFTQLFFYLPKSILAAVVISAVFGLIDLREARYLMKTHRGDFIVLLVTFLLTLLLGIQKGVFVGVVLSLLFILRKVSRPHYAVLGNIHGTDRYRNIERFMDASVNEEQLIFRYDEDIFFGNAEHFYNAILKEVEAKGQLKEVILDMSSVGNIDSTGVHQFELLMDAMHNHGVELHLCSAKGPLRDILAKVGIAERMGDRFVHWNVKDAVKNIKESKGTSND